MEFELKLYVGRGELIPSSFVCVPSETLKIVPNKAFKGHTALIVGENAYPLENGMFCVPSEDLQATNTFEVQEYEASEVKRKWKVGNVVATSPPPAMEYQDALDFWQSKYFASALKMKEYEKRFAEHEKEFAEKLNAEVTAIVAMIMEDRKRITTVEATVFDKVTI